MNFKSGIRGGSNWQSGDEKGPLAHWGNERGFAVNWGNKVSWYRTWKTIPSYPFIYYLMVKRHFHADHLILFL